jgi:hypothetical protein
MAQDTTGKLKNIAGDATVQAKTILAALILLMHDSAVLAQTGGDFPAGVFNNSNLNYLTEYQANVFLQTVVPALNTFMDSHIGGDTAQPTHREYFQMMVSGSY